MALRLEKAFGVNLETLMRMQASYDIALTRQRSQVDYGAALSTAAGGIAGQRHRR